MRRFSLVFTLVVITIIISLASSLSNSENPYTALYNSDDIENDRRREKIKEMMIHAWSNYKHFAWGGNELSPTLQRTNHHTVFGHANIGATIIDAMDTLYIMGLKSEYNDGREWIATEFNLDHVNYKVSVFETNIRYVGGFLSLYALTGDALYKEKAKYVADKLLPAFDTPTGIPFSDISFMLKNTSEKDFNYLAEFGTLYLEFAYLSEITDDPVYKKVVERIYDTLEMVHDQKELYPSQINPLTGIWNDTLFTLGAYADSFYEYLLKIWIQSGYKNDRFKQKFLDVIVTVVEKLVKKSKSGYVFIASIEKDRLRLTMEHLTCYTGGLFALAAKTEIHKNSSAYLKLAKEITQTCHESYIQTPTGLGPETFSFGTADKIVGGGSNFYALRPETVESYFYLWRCTKEQKYRDWGWELVQSLEKYCRTPFGFCGIANVYINYFCFYDHIQQSFFLAETLKYLYLLYSDDTLLPLDKWVFNTEAHPLPILNEHHLKCRRPTIFPLKDNNRLQQ